MTARLQEKRPSTRAARRTAIATLGIGAVLFTGIAASAADTSASQPTTTELLKQIQDLQNKVQQLSDKQQQTQIVSTQEVDATVQKVLQDSQQRSQLLQMEGFTGGWDKGRFFIGSADGNFTLRPWIHLQIRNSTNWRNDAKGGTSDDLQNGFELRRARLGFDGNLFSKDFTYLIDWATYRGNSTANVVDATNTKIGTVSQGNGGLPVLEEAWVKYRLPDSSWYIKAGQMHDPLDHEAIVGSKYRSAEVSLTGDIFANTDTFTQGATVIYDPKQNLRFEGGVTDGIRAANTNFADYPNNGTLYDWGVAGRVEYKVMGKWKDYDQLTALNDKEALLVLGAGVDNSQGGRDDQFSHTFDVQYANPQGLFVYGSYFGRYTNYNKGIPSGAPTSTTFGTPGVVGQDTYEWSGLGEVAYLIDGKFEPFGRYEYLHLAGTPAGSQNNVHAISGGINYYFYGHNAKFTGQVMYLPNGIPINDDSNDILISNDKPEVNFIAQFQLLL